jgi:hypothetical protein
MGDSFVQHFVLQLLKAGEFGFFSDTCLE